MSRIIIEVAGSIVYQIPLVVWPTLAFLLSSSKVVPNNALSKVDFPELWEPIIDIVWYVFFNALIFFWFRLSSYSILNDDKYT